MPPFFTSTYRPSQPLSSDLSLIPRLQNPYSERDKLFGIKPLPSFNKVPQPFNAAPNLYAQQNSDLIETVSTNLHVYPSKTEQISVSKVGPSIKRNGQPQIDVPLASNNIREIDPFDSKIDRFAIDANVKQRQRIVLPMNLANAPLESFLRRIDPVRQNRPVVSVGTQPVHANTRYLGSDLNSQSTTTTLTPLVQGLIRRNV